MQQYILHGTEIRCNPRWFKGCLTLSTCTPRLRIDIRCDYHVILNQFLFHCKDSSLSFLLFKTNCFSSYCTISVPTINGILEDKCLVLNFGFFYPWFVFSSQENSLKITTDFGNWDWHYIIFTRLKNQKNFWKEKLLAFLLTTNTLQLHSLWK